MRNETKTKDVASNKQTNNMDLCALCSREKQTHPRVSVSGNRFFHGGDVASVRLRCEQKGIAITSRLQCLLTDGVANRARRRGAEPPGQGTQTTPHMRNSEGRSKVSE